MKRMFYTLLIVSFSTFYHIQSMQHVLPYLSNAHHAITNFSFQLPSHYFKHCHNYLKNCDVGKALMIGALGILLLDKIYPIFPVKKTKVILPYETFNQTEIINHIKSEVTNGINEFKKTEYEPNNRAFNQEIMFIKLKEESLTIANKPKSETHEKEEPIEHTSSDKQDNVSPKLELHFEKIADTLGQKTQNPLQGSFDIYEINHDEITRVETVKKEFLKIFAEIEKKLLKKINRKFLKIKKKSPLFSSLPVIPEASSTSDNDNDENIKSEEADDIFGPLNNNVFKDSALVDSALLMTQEGICKQKNAQQITPCILRSNGDDLDILLEENN